MKSGWYVLMENISFSKQAISYVATKDKFILYV